MGIYVWIIGLRTCLPVCSITDFGLIFSIVLRVKDDQHDKQLGMVQESPGLRVCLMRYSMASCRARLGAPKSPSACSP
jgi:hypothetical protein